MKQSVHDEPELKKRIRQIDIERVAQSAEAEVDRARSFYVGKNANAVELCLRGDGRRFLWYIMNEKEVIETIHALAASIGCHIALKPREDFGSFRDWQLTEKERLFWDRVEAQPVQRLNHQEVHHEPKKIMATEKAVIGRKSKRASAST